MKFLPLLLLVACSQDVQVKEEMDAADIQWQASRCYKDGLRAVFISRDGQYVVECRP